MEHPFINDLDGLSSDELLSKITDLRNKLTIAMRSGNGYLCDQIRMAIESYQTKYNQRLQEQWKSGTGGRNLDDKIDIS